jgi:hypothetical protein
VLKPYQCQHCFKGFKSEEGVRYHVRNRVCFKHNKTTGVGTKEPVKEDIKNNIASDEQGGRKPQPKRRKR